MSPLSDQNLTHGPPAPATCPPTLATIDLSALAHNLARVRSHVAPSCEILAVVKANAYGHGAVSITRALARLGVGRFGVATLAEGIALRDAGITAPVLVMGPLFPDEAPVAITHELTPVVYEAAQVDQLAQHLVHWGRPYPVHLKIDTGMARLGMMPEEIPQVVGSAHFRTRLKLEGLMTHLADADNQDPAFTRHQLERFASVVNHMAAMGLHVPLVHAANSAAILRHPSSHFTAVRPGIMLYGYHTLADEAGGPDLKPVLKLSTKVAQIRSLAVGRSVSYNCTYTAPCHSRVAVLPVGYADGYSRHLSNRGAVLIHGCRAPVVGRVCMDMTMVDVTEIPEVQPGDEAVLIGRQGGMQITAQDLAVIQGTIPYEVLCAIGPRVPRVYRP